MAEKSSQEEVTAGHQAKRLLDDPVFRDAQNEVRAECVAKWSDPDSTLAQRELMWAQLQALDAISAALEYRVKRGSTAQAMMERQSRR